MVTTFRVGASPGTAQHDRWSLWDTPMTVESRVAPCVSPWAVASEHAGSTSSAAAAQATCAEELMQRYQRGDESAFRELYGRYRLPLVRFVRQLTPDVQAAQEIVQETWIAVVQGRERYAPTSRFVTYLFSIARRRTMDLWRREKRSPARELEGLEPDDVEGPCGLEPDWQFCNQALGEALLAAVSALPVLQREAFLLRAEGDLSLEEIAEITGTGRETVKSRIRYALQRLRVSLESFT